MDKEIWKDVKDYDGLYQVSDLGRVKSLKRTVNKWNGTRTINERILKQTPLYNGYLRVDLYKNKINKTISVHQLVAINFLNHLYIKQNLVVNHINFNKQDNRLENLEIVTQRTNTNKKHLKSTSRYTGVSLNKLSKKWSAEIVINGRKKYLGYFINEYDAHLAYEKELLIINK